MERRRRAGAAAARGGRSSPWRGGLTGPAEHHRVVGRRGTFRRPMLDNLLCPFGEPRPPLWFVYPDYVFLGHDGDEKAAGRRRSAPAERRPAGGTGVDGHLLRRLPRPPRGGQHCAGLAGPAAGHARRRGGRLQFLAYCSTAVPAAGTGHDQVTLWDTTTGEAWAGWRTARTTGRSALGWPGLAAARLVTADAGHGYWSGAAPACRPATGPRRAPRSASRASPDGRVVGAGQPGRGELCLRRRLVGRAS
ncbi:MAG: hypothetical protein U0797_09190 [Gemmataceae bacterium]